MAQVEKDMVPFRQGLLITDSNNETPEGSLTVASDVMLTTDGAVRQRYGTSASNQRVSAVASLLAYRQGSASKMVLFNGAGAGAVYLPNGTAMTGSALPGIPSVCDGYAQAIDAGGTNRVYVARNNAVISRFTPSANTFADVTNAPKCRYLAAGMMSERLWAAGFTAGANGPGGATAGPRYLWWSDAADPETWRADSFQLFGEDIQGIASFNGQIFIFGLTKFWVATSLTSGGGTTTLNYREVNGAGLARPRAFVVTDEGIYFLGSDGVYLTTGVAPTKVSGNIDGLFTGNLPAWCVYDRLTFPAAPTLPIMAEANGCIYLLCSGGYSTTATDVLLSYRMSTGAWTINRVPNILGLVGLPGSDVDADLLFGPVGVPASSNFGAFTMHPQLTTDNGVWIPSEFQANWFAVSTGEGNIALDQTQIRRLDAFGIGHAQVGVAIDFQPAVGGWNDMNFGPLPAADVWGDGTNPADVWGDGSDPADVWGAGLAVGTDLLRLAVPNRVSTYNLFGRGRYLSVHFRKMQDSSYFYVDRPRMALIGRGG